MIADNVQLSGVCLVADESAEWRCAGLRQIDRLLLALNAWRGRTGDSPQALPVYIRQVAATSAGGLAGKRLPNLRVTPDEQAFASCLADATAPVAIISTRLMVEDVEDSPGWLGQSSDGVSLVAPRAVNDALASGNFAQLSAEAVERSKTSQSEHFLDGPGDLGRYEERLLRNTGKTQDGVIARYLNRPLSRAVTRFLLRFPISPNVVTVALMILPAIGLWLLWQGSYWGFVAGAFFFQLHSALDGCDGEIARVKYLQSDLGATLDQVCDRLSSLMFAIGLGVGLWHELGSHPGRFYLVEGIVAALVIGIGETWLTRRPLDFGSDAQSAIYAEQHGADFNRGDQLKLWIMRHSRMLAVGETFANFFSQMTKRDVFNFGFLLLALAGRPTWILHIFGACALIILALALARLFTSSSSRPGKAG